MIVSKYCHKSEFNYNFDLIINFFVTIDYNYMPHAHVHNKIVYRTVMANSVLAASGRRSTFINAKFLLNLDAKFVPVI